MSTVTKNERIRAILEAFDDAIDLGKFQHEAREDFERELTTTGELDFLDDPEVKKPSATALEAIQARYEYLRKSGQWQRDTTGDLYLRGFEDAMKVLGLLPMVGP